jgi:hypothetical protein
MVPLSDILKKLIALALLVTVVRRTVTLDIFPLGVPSQEP